MVADRQLRPEWILSVDFSVQHFFLKGKNMSRTTLQYRAPYRPGVFDFFSLSFIQYTQAAAAGSGLQGKATLEPGETPEILVRRMNLASVCECDGRDLGVGHQVGAGRPCSL